jgi:hypothetical protein
MRPLSVAMACIPTDVTCSCHKKQEYIWFTGENFNVFEIFGHLLFCLRGDGTNMYGHDLHTIRCYLIQ